MTNFFNSYYKQLMYLEREKIVKQKKYEIFVFIFKISDFFEQIYLNGAGCGKWNLKNQNLCKILSISIKYTFCSSLFLYNFETYQKLPYKINSPGYKLYPFSCTSQCLRIIYWAFSDPQRPGLPEIYPKIWRFRHCLNPKNVHFWTKKTHCAASL